MEDVSSQVEEVKEVTQKVPAEELATKDELQALADKLPAEGGGLTPQELGERVEAMEKKAEEAAANEVPISSILHTANRTVSERMFVGRTARRRLTSRSLQQRQSYSPWPTNCPVTTAASATQR